MHEPDLRKPDPPPAERLNARAGILLGAMLAVTVVAILFAINAKAPRLREPAGPPADPAPSQPAFLGKPAAEPAAAPPPSDPRLEEVLAEEERRRALGELPPAPGEAPFVAPSAQSPQAPPPDPRREAFRRALRAPLEATPSLGAPPASGVSATASLPAAVPGLTDLAAAVGSATPAPGPRDGRSAPFAGFLQSVSRPASSELAVRWESPRAEPTLQAGTVLPAVLVTAINSDLPGDLIAQVTRDVYDSATLHTVLVPAGSRLLGRYDHQVELGQDRLLVAWTRLLLPDGRSLSFPGLPATTPSGEAGLAGSTDNHLRRVFGNAILLSLVSAGVQLSQPQESAAFGQAASTRQVAGAALGQELGSVALEILRRGLDRRPTLRIPAGAEFYVFVNGDISFPGAPVR